MSAFTDQLENDLDKTFFNKEEFAEEVTITPWGDADPYIIKAIFDNDYQAVDVDTNQPVSSTQPMIRIHESDLQAALNPRDKFTIRGKVYTITDKQPDGVGTIAILLNEGIS